MGHDAWRPALRMPCVAKGVPYRGWRGDGSWEDWWNRLGFALNQTFATEEPHRYAALAEDANRYVRAAAKARLRGESPAL